MWLAFLLITGCGGKDSSKSSNKVKAVNDNVSTLSLASGNYIAEAESSSILGNAVGLVAIVIMVIFYLKRGQLSIKDNNNLTGVFG